MKITGLSVAAVDGGFVVTATAFFASNEALESTDMTWLMAQIEEAYPVDKVSRDTSGPQSMADAASDPQPGARRRRVSADAPALPIASAEASPVSNGQTATGDQPATGTRRRRTVTEATAADAQTAPATQPENNAGPQAETTTRRRRRATAGDASSVTPTTAGSTAPATAQPSATPEGTRRLRTASDAAPLPTAPTTAPSAPAPATTPLTTISPSKDDGGYTDADLAKAASQAASVITPKVVMEILAEFKVPSTDKLVGAERAEFVKMLMDEIKAQS